jgi:hypothetical protein
MSALKYSGISSSLMNSAASQTGRAGSAGASRRSLK